MKEKDTFIEENPELEKEKKKYSKKQKKTEVSYEEIQAKLVRIYNFLAVMLKSKKRYTEKDFLEESKDIARLSVKYEPIAVILTLLDPFFAVMGLINKFFGITEEIKKSEKVEEHGKILAHKNQ